MERPYFAYAINTKLQRKAKDPATNQKVKGAAKMSQITLPSRTVAFIEEGTPAEKPPMSIMPQGDGEPKSAGRSFVERYGGVGVVTFIDGHAETFSAKELITTAGRLIWLAGETPRVVWCRTPEEDPN